MMRPRLFYAYLKNKENLQFHQLLQLLLQTESSVHGITRLVIPSTAATVNQSCCAHNTELTSVEIHSNSIAWTQFSGCTKLESVVVGTEVKNISYNPFAGCTNLTTLTYEGTQEEWNNIGKDTRWLLNASITTIICTDGQITL